MASLRGTLTNTPPDGELPFPFARDVEEDQVITSHWFKHICVATLRFALYLRSRDPQDLDKAQDLLQNSQVPASQSRPYGAAVSNCHATTLEAYGSIEQSTDAVERRMRLKEKDRQAYTLDLASSLLRLSNLVLHDRGGRQLGYTVDVLTKSAHSVLESQVPVVLSNLSNRLYDLGLVGESLDVAQGSIALLRDNRLSSTVDHVTLAGVHNNLANRLEGAGRYAESITSIEKAVQHYRSAVVSHQTPEDAGDALNPHLLNLVISLTNLSQHHLNFGNRTRATEAIKEAVETCRRLSLESKNPAEFYVPLSSALLVQSLSFSSSGRLEDALEASREVVRLRRFLVSVDPHKHTPDLALSLSRLSYDLSALGQLEGALTEIKEAVRIFRELALRRVAFIPSLAKCIGDLSDRLADIGLHEDAVTSARESVLLHELELEATDSEETESPKARYTPVRTNSTTLQSSSFMPSPQIDEDPFHRRLHAKAIAVIQKALPILLQSEIEVSEEKAISTVHLAVALNDLSNRLSLCGRYQEALEAIERAVQLQSGVRKGPLITDTSEAKFATSLRCRSDRLGELGRHKDALDQIEQATSILRSLQLERPGSFTAEYAMSLQSCSDRLFEVGQYQEARKKMEKAVKLYRSLVDWLPDAHFPGLGTTLRRFSDLVSKLGEHSNARRAAEESVTIFQRLANLRRDAYVPEVALSLLSLSCRLSDSGLHRDALIAVQSSVQWYRILADERRAVFTPDLALSLRTLSDRYSDLNMYARALFAIEEAVSLHEKLTRDQGNTYLPELALSLCALSTRLSDLGRLEEALPYISRSCGILRGLAKDWPASFKPPLAFSLRILSNCHSDLQQHDDALTYMRESLGLYKELAEKEDIVYYDEVATAFRTLSTLLHERGFDDEALATIQESLETYKLIDNNRHERKGREPTSLTTDRAATLLCLSNRLSDRGRHQEALAPIKGAVKLYRELAGVRHEEFRSDLARQSFYTLWCLLRLGPNAESLRESREDFDIFADAVTRSKSTKEDEWVAEDMEEAARALVSLESECMTEAPMS